MAFAFADLAIIKSDTRRLRPGLPGERALIDNDAHGQVLSRDQHLIDVDRGGCLGLRLRRPGALAGREKGVCGPESHDGDGAGNKQSLIHQTPSPRPTTVVSLSSQQIIKTWLTLTVRIGKIDIISSINSECYSVR